MTHQIKREMDASATSVDGTAQTLPVRAALLALRFYKAYLSMLIAGSCRYEPTCSQFTYQAVERFGVLRGSWLGLKRLLRCHPFSRRFGFDPVPEEWPHARSHSASDSTAHAATLTGLTGAAPHTQDGSRRPSLSNHKEAHS